jgi:flagellar basal-body rod protein FlgB
MWKTAMLEQIVGGKALDVMQRGMGAANLRQEVISHNIANVNTPNFKKSDVIFEDLLAKELDLDATGRLKVVRTHDRHMPIAFRGRAAAKVELDPSSSMRYDKNNVDIDVEMASLAKNSLYFNALARQVGAEFSRMRTVVAGQ